MKETFDHTLTVKNRAKELRKNLTRYELMFLRRLALANIASFDFQVRIGFYIVDFVFPNKMLIVEIDGAVHVKRQEYDRRRDGFLVKRGFTVWRLQNKDAAHCSLDPIRNHPLSARQTYYAALSEAGAIHKQTIATPKADPSVLDNKVLGPGTRPIKIVKANKILEEIFA